MKKGFVQFEATKAGIAQISGGWSLRLNIHPNELPEEVLHAAKGANWYVVITEMPHSEEEAEAGAGKRALAMAGALCKQPLFWDYLNDSIGEVTWTDVVNEEQAAEALRSLLNISSRAILGTDSSARDRLYEINRGYQRWVVHR